MHTLNPQDELRRLFSGLVEHAFYADLGICVPALTDYLARMLADFIHVDRIYRLRTVDGEIIREVSRLQAEAHLGPDVSSTYRDRVINRYIGDFTLFWVGMYPETLTGRRQGGVDRLREYVLQGRRGYDIASRLSRSDDAPPPTILHDLSEQFDWCVEGLHFVRQNWEQLGRQPRHN